MLMAMTIGTLAASAQSAQRGTPHKEQQRKSAPAPNSRAQRSQSMKSNNKASGKQLNSRSDARKDNAVRSTSTRQEPSRQVNSRSNNRNNNAVRSTPGRQEPNRQVNTRSNAQKSTATRSSSARQEPNRQVTSRSANQKSQAYRGNNDRRSGAPATIKNNSRKVSTTTRNNSRSDYRSPNRSLNAGKTHLDPKPRTTQANRNPHVVVNRNHNSKSHAVHRNYYPSKKVKVHVHPRTYHNHYKVMYYPSHREIVWTNRMHRYYVDLYPGYTWRYNIGYHIQTISAFEARYNVGEVARVYGRVYATWYNRDSDDLLLFFGGEFPYQEFTMVVPGHIARRYNWRPERYFLGQHILATGLITSYDGSPEMIIRNKSQMDIY